MKKHIAPYVLTLIYFLLTCSAFCQTPNPNFELYILMGQSNMAGRGAITDSLKNLRGDSVFAFSKEHRWVIAKHPLHFDKPTAAAVGPGLSFGIAMAHNNKKVRIGLIPCAVGGTSIQSWVPGAFDAATKTHPYDDAVERIRVAMQYGVIKGVIWHQGESDSTPEKSKVYLDNLTQLISRVRALVNDPDLPFIVGELGEFYKTHQAINDQLALLPARTPFTAVVSSKGLSDKGDSLHFSGASANELGKRYADKMIAIQKQSAHLK